MSKLAVIHRLLNRRYQRYWRAGVVYKILQTRWQDLFQSNQICFLLFGCFDLFLVMISVRFRCLEHDYVHMRDYEVIRACRFDLNFQGEIDYPKPAFGCSFWKMNCFYHCFVVDFVPCSLFFKHLQNDLCGDIWSIFCLSPDIRYLLYADINNHTYNIDEIWWMFYLFLFVQSYQVCLNPIPLVLHT